MYQDFYATIYLTGVESLLSADTDALLAAKAVSHPEQVNRAVSFNAIKYQALALLLSKLDSDVLVVQLARLFRTNPTCSQPEREVARRKKSARHLLDYWKQRRKVCF